MTEQLNVPHGSFAAPAAAEQPAASLPASVSKTSVRLADGRELIYFDEPGAGRDRVAAADWRPLPPHHPTSAMRFDRALREWVTIAGHRQDRTYLPPDDECPLCPSRDGHATEIPARDYDVVVFENRFPSFAQAAAAQADGPLGRKAPLDGSDGGFFVERPALGRCEVVCFTSDHDAAFSSLTPTRARTVIEAWIDRTRALSSIPGIEQVFCFENRGKEIGVTLNHPHGQVYGYPFVTPRTRQMLDAARAHLASTGRNLFAEILRQETEDGQRVVARNASWTAFVPFAARWPLEVHLYPNRQAPDLTALDEQERADLSHLYLEVLRRMEGVHDDTLPYISAWHQAPTHEDRDLAYLHLEVFSVRRAPGKLKYLAGSESAMGAFVNDVLPEDAARLLREVTL